MRTNASAIAAIALLFLVGCSSSPGDSATASMTPSIAPSGEPQGPGGVVAIGHSGLTGRNADPALPGQDIRDASWATGLSPEVNSVYLRLVAARPENDGLVANRAEDGALVATLPAQAEAAL